MKLIPVGKIVELNITQDDIDHGVKSSCDSCPISLAMLRTFPNMKQANTGVGRVALVPKKRRMVYRFEPVVDEEARKFIATFDSGRVAKPTTITYKREM